MPSAADRVDFLEAQHSEADAEPAWPARVGSINLFGQGFFRSCLFAETTRVDGTSLFIVDAEIAC